MQQISESFTVPQSADRVWEAFQDVPRVVTCMPGLEYLGETGPDTHAGRVKMKLGPISANFEGQATFVKVDPAARTAELEARGSDKKGGSQARADVVYQIEETGPGESRVTLSGTIRLTGALAHLGRSSIVKDVARHLTEQFAASLRLMLAESAAGEPAASGATEVSGDTPASPSESPAPPMNKQAISGFAVLKAILQGWLRRVGLVRT